MRECLPAELCMASDTCRPVAMSTKRQVSRFRNVVDVPRIDRRDPRFSSLSAGQVNAELHSKGYSFLPEMLADERARLKDEVKRLSKLEKTCKLVEKPGVIAQKEEAELQLSKVLNRLTRLKREEAERSALATAKKEEREKRESGKGAWYMKKCKPALQAEPRADVYQRRRRSCCSRPDSSSLSTPVENVLSTRPSRRRGRRSRARRRSRGLSSRTPLAELLLGQAGREDV